MDSSRFTPSRYIKPSTLIPLVLCISAAAQGRVLLPDESVVVTQGDTPESWTMATGSTLTVNSGAQTLSIGGGGAGSVVNLNAGSSAGRVNLSAGGAVANITGASVTASGTDALVLLGSSAVLNNASVISTTGLGLFGTQIVNGSGSSFLINGGTITGATGGASLSSGSKLDATGAVITGTNANSYGVRGFGSDISLRNSTVTGGLNGLLYRVDPANVQQGTVNIEGSYIEGTNGAAILFNGQGGGMVADLNLLNGTTLTGGNGNALEVTNSATANVLLQNSEVTGNFAISNGSVANLTFDAGRLIGNVSADATSTGTLALNNGSAVTGDVSGIDTVNLNASSIIGNVTSASSAGVVSLANGSVLEGNVISDNASLTASQMKGNITSMGSAGVVTLAGGSLLAGDISSNNVNLSGSQMIGDITSISSAGVVSLVDGSVLEGNASSDKLSLSASQMTGDLTSISSAGVVSLVGNSTLRGNVSSDKVSLSGSRMNGDITSLSAAGLVTLAGGSALEGNVNSDNVNLDASSITGDVASAGSAGVLKLLAGSTLKGDVSSNVSLDASSMSGNITSAGGVVSLANNSVFTGNLINVGSATLAGSSIWDMVGTNTVSSLAMNDSTVRFGAPNAFYQLNVGTLSGNGTFVMDADYATNQHDTLNITGSATGNHTLRVAGSGVDPVAPGPLTLVHSAGGDAAFALADRRAVDVGTYSYELTSAGDGMGGTDWFLDPSRPTTVTPGARSVLALFNTAPTVWYGELTSLRSRMGELRFNGGKAGGWVRTYGNKYNVSDASGVGYQQNQQGVSLGADAPLPIGDGQWLVGVLAGYSKSDLNLDRGTSGTVKSTYVGAYTTWLDQDSGYYFDGVLKANRFRNDSKVSMSDGARAKGDYTTQGVGASLEFGRHIKLDDGYFVEPFAQVSGVVIGGKDYGLNNGMQAEGDRTRSLLGKVGVTTGRSFALENGSIVQPYLRVAAAQEFAKNNEVQVNNNVFNNDLSGSRGELGAGVAVAMSDSLQLHADFDYSNGENIEQPFGANVGVRYSW